VQQAAGYAVQKGIDYIARQQMDTGEIPSLAADKHVRKSFIYVKSPFISTFVHDALRSVAKNGQDSLGGIGARARSIQRGIRDFLLCEEETDHTWRFFGRGSRIDSDADCTSCCAVVLLSHGVDPDIYTASLARFKGTEDIYYSYRDRHGTLYSWIQKDGTVIQEYDRVVNANVARFLTLAGVPCQPVWRFLEAELVSSPLDIGSPDYPSPLCLFYMIARALWETGHELLPAATESLKLHLRLVQETDGCFGGPLSTALATLAWHYLDMPRKQIRSALSGLLDMQTQDGRWEMEPFFVGDYGSPSLTTALVVEALVRWLIVPRQPGS